MLSRILPGIAIVSGQIFVCGGEVDSKILANGEVRILVSHWLISVTRPEVSCNGQGKLR